MTVLVMLIIIIILSNFKQAFKVVKCVLGGLDSHDFRKWINKVLLRKEGDCLYYNPPKPTLTQSNQCKTM